jgi:hypothetical protein
MSFGPHEAADKKPPGFHTLRILIYGILREKVCDDWGQHHIFLAIGGLMDPVKDRGGGEGVPTNLTGGRILHPPEAAVSIFFCPDRLSLLRAMKCLILAKSLKEQ